MKHLLTAFGSVCIPFLFVSCVAHHTCGSKEMMEMKGSGFSVDEINKTCTSYKIPDEMFKLADQALRNELAKNFKDKKQSTTAIAQAATCATQVGVCPLMQPGYSGAPCTCAAGYAQFQGVMR